MTTKTKPSATSASTTAFCQARIDGPGGLHLFLDGNGKITAGNGTLDDPKPNAFSLLPIADCPGHTKECSNFCFVSNIAKFAPDTYALYAHNSKTIREIVSNPSLANEWANTMGRWIEENCSGGFRWSVSGDIFSLAYARFITMVCHCSQPVKHWIYTRSFFAVETLGDPMASNLVVNISADAENYRHARATADSFRLKVCYVTTDGSVPDDLKDGDVIFPDYALRGGTEKGQEWFAGLSSAYKSYVCPVDYAGKAENRRCGPCKKCLK